MSLSIALCNDIHHHSPSSSSYYPPTPPSLATASPPPLHLPSFSFSRPTSPISRPPSSLAHAASFSSSHHHMPVKSFGDAKPILTHPVGGQAPLPPPLSPPSPSVPVTNTIHSPTTTTTTTTTPPPFETFHGFVRDQHDAHLLVESCISKHLVSLKIAPLSASRPRSGSVLVFEESPGITRWRDGALWSPSRICGAFLLYREVAPSSSIGVISDDRAMQSYARARFGTTSFRKGTRPVRDGFAKRTMSVQGSDGKRYRVISYFYPRDVEHLYSGNTSDVGAAALRTPRDVHAAGGFPWLKDTPAVSDLDDTLVASPSPRPSMKRIRAQHVEDDNHLGKKRCAEVSAPTPCSIQFLIG